MLVFTYTFVHFTYFTYFKGFKNYNLLFFINFLDTDRVYPSTYPLDSESHGGEDVPIFASGPMSHIFTGVHEQTFIAHGMAYAACIGENKEHCGQPTSQTTESPPSGSDTKSYSAIVMFFLVSYLIFL